MEHLFPFSSERKRMSTVVLHRDGNIRMYTKGASEIVLDYCTFYLAVRRPAAAVVDRRGWTWSAAPRRSRRRDQVCAGGHITRKRVMCVP